LFVERNPDSPNWERPTESILFIFSTFKESKLLMEPKIINVFKGANGGQWSGVISNLPVGTYGLTKKVIHFEN
jgi:hypothetical protein